MGEEESERNIPILKEDSKKAIKDLLGLAYEALKEPNYIGYPTSDLIQCFLDAETALKSEFPRMFDDAIPTYRGKWKQFKEEIIEKRLNEILDELVTLKLKEGTGKLTKNSKFDDTSEEYKLMSNISVSASLFTIFYYITRSNKDWISDVRKKEKLEKCITGFINSRIPKKGWQYCNTGKGKISGVLPTWLSILALEYIPKEIINAMDLNEEINTAKTEVGRWLIDSKTETYQKDQDGTKKYYTWSFQPEREEGKPNPTATAQAILALRALKVDGIDEIIASSVNYIKDKKDEIDDSVTATIDIETKIRLMGTLTPEIPFSHPGIQQCLRVLLIETSSTDNIVVSLLNKNLEKSNDFLEHLPKFKECNGSENEDIREEVTTDTREIYPTLLSFLYYFRPPTLEGLLLDYTEFKSEFESFVSKAQSVIVVGEVDEVYGNRMPPKVTIFCQPTLEPFLQCRYPNWKRYTLDWKFENINCVIVDKKEGLISCNPFKETGQYNIIKHMEEDEVSNLINQLEEIVGVKIRSPEEEIEEIISEKFPKQSGIMNLKDLKSNQLEGILEYYKPNPEYSEAVPSSLGFVGGENRVSIEVGFTNRGIISRVFMNSKLESLINGEIKDENLVMDESSAYLLLNSSKRDENVKFLLEVVKGDLCVLSDAYKSLKSPSLLLTDGGRLRPIEEEIIDTKEIQSERYHLTENEKIVIAYTQKKRESKHGIITNTWEVAKMCPDLGINVYSLVKFLDKNEETYKMFRIPVDLLREE